MHEVPLGEHPEPDIFYDDDATPAVWRRFILEVLIPKYWDSSAAAFAALEAESQKWADFYREFDGKAEERAVVAALAKDGPMDSASILQARVQREEDRDRVTCAKLQQRMLADDDGADGAETELD